MEKKVSIITVCLNSENTIRKTIESVINQEYPNLEYIIVDGMSSDKTMDIVKSYGKFIDKIICEHDNGIYDAMNKGIKAATGDYIGIINSDDWYENDSLHKIVDAFEGEDAEVVYGQQKNVDDEGEITIVKNGILSQMVYRMVIPHPTAFVKSEVYKKVGLFNTEYKIAADYELFLKMYMSGVKIKQIDSTIAYFRMGGTSSIQAVRCAEEIKKIAMKNAKLFNRTELFPTIQKYYQHRLDKAEFQKHIQAMRENYFNFDALRNKKVYIFGAGSVGKMCYQLLKKEKICINGFVDNNLKDKSFMNLPIITLKKCEKEGSVIIVSSMNYRNEMIQELEENGYEKGRNYFLYNELK